MNTSMWVTVALLIPSVAHAQGTETSRFQLEKTEQGIVRLDTQTGAMTLCRDENGTLACRMQPDERAAYEAELDRLEKRVTALEERLSHTPLNALPSDEEVDRSLSIMERFMRRFMAIVGEFVNQREADPPPPNRT